MVSERAQAVDDYLNGRITRKQFMRKLAELGCSGSVISIYANSLRPKLKVDEPAAADRAPVDAAEREEG